MNRTCITGLAALSLCLSLCLSQGDAQVDPPPSAVEAPSAADIDRALDRGFRWLLTQQAADGGWHSSTYGALRPGVGTTALILSALSQSPDTLPLGQERAFQRGLSYLTSREQDNGLVCAPNGDIDSPVYATALLLSALQWQPREEEIELRKRLVDALLRARRTGNSPDPEVAVSAGGWSPDPWSPGEPSIEGPANVSVTAHVLDALSLAKVLPDADRTEALRFLDRTRGWNESRSALAGFAFTPRIDSPLNKAGWSETPDGRRARSYHSATCDGLLAMRACGLAWTDSRLSADLSVLAELTPPSLSRTPPDLTAGLFYYDAAVLGDVWRQTHDPRLSSQRTERLAALLAQQRSDGSWVNPHGWMREDDPLISTPLALLGLLRLRSTPPAAP